MPRRSPSSSTGSTDGSSADRAFKVLLVDSDSAVRRTLAQAVTGQSMTLIQASTLAEARARLAAHRIDLALIEPNLPDGSGLELAQELGSAGSLTQTIVITGQPSLERAIEAIRSGAADLLVKPLNLAEVNERVRQAVIRRKLDLRRRRRVTRLRRLCGKLNAARHEVTQQVDILCNDLVTAYQELATQMNQVAQTGEFAGLVGNELDLERLLRQTLEYILQKAGPTNAAVFLPSSVDEYAVGGYVNYDCTKDSADVLLQHLADVVASRVGKHAEAVHITDNDTLYQWIGNDAAYLEDSHVLAFSCAHDGEPLAVLILFRDGGEPFSDQVVEACTSIRPLLADYLVKIIKIHHRHLPDGAAPDGGETLDGTV